MEINLEEQDDNGNSDMFYATLNPYDTKIAKRLY